MRTLLGLAIEVLALLAPILINNIRSPSQQLASVSGIAGEMKASDR